VPQWRLVEILLLLLLLLFQLLSVFPDFPLELSLFPL
jgi:hypothetical protein